VVTQNIHELCPQDFKTIIDDNNVFQLSVLRLMKCNSYLLPEHLRNILCLSIDESYSEREDIIIDTDRPLLNAKILEEVTQLQPFYV
jgi:hypothetical protein